MCKYGPQVSRQTPEGSLARRISQSIVRAKGEAVNRTSGRRPIVGLLGLPAGDPGTRPEGATQPRACNRSAGDEGGRTPALAVRRFSQSMVSVLAVLPAVAGVRGASDSAHDILQPPRNRIGSARVP